MSKRALSLLPDRLSRVYAGWRRAPERAQVSVAPQDWVSTTLLGQLLEPSQAPGNAVTGSSEPHLPPPERG